MRLTKTARCTRPVRGVRRKQRHARRPTRGAPPTTASIATSGVQVWLGELEVGIDVATEVLCDGLDAEFIHLHAGVRVPLDVRRQLRSVEYEPTHPVPSPGSYTVILPVTDPAGCLEPVNTEIEVNIQQPPSPVIMPVEPVCEGEEVQLIANGSSDLVWTPHPLIEDETLAVQNLTPPVGATTFSVTDVNNCGEGEASITVLVQAVQAEVTPSTTAICLGESVSLIAEGAANAAWSSGLDNPNARSTSRANDTYTVVLTDNLGCSGETEGRCGAGPPGDRCTHRRLCGLWVIAHCRRGPMALEHLEFVNDPGLQFPYATPEETTTFTVSIANICGTGTDQITVEVLSKPASEDEYAAANCLVSAEAATQLDVHVGAGSETSPNGALQLHPGVHGLRHRREGCATAGDGVRDNRRNQCRTRPWVVGRGAVVWPSAGTGRGVVATDCAVLDRF